ncbi:hypothetical protein LSAT2_023234 [Lamellibrachia satsuma]|nr:hypothetical protein LSAT2_023234 [Lamellibrachia satsuma]
MDDNNNAVSSHDKLNGSGSGCNNDDAGDEGKGMPEKRERTAAEIRKSNKPLMEKRRRERINSCLDQLKSILMEVTKKERQALVVVTHPATGPGRCHSPSDRPWSLSLTQRQALVVVTTQRRPWSLSPPSDRPWSLSLTQRQALVVVTHPATGPGRCHSPSDRPWSLSLTQRQTLVVVTHPATDPGR